MALNIASSHAVAGVQTFSSSKFQLKPFIDVPLYGIDLIETVSGQAVSWQPNVRGNTGIDVHITDLIGFGFAARGPMAEEDRLLKGETQYQDWRFSFAFRSFHLVANYQSYEGFFLENSAEIDPSLGPTGGYIKDPAMKAVSASTGMTWIFSPQVFSMEAALDQTVRQDSSGGSWLAGVYLARTRFSSDNGLIPASLQAQFGNEGTTRALEFTSLTARGGYGHTFVYNNTWFLTLLMQLGIGQQLGLVETATLTKKPNQGSSSSNVIVSMGYNGDENFFGATSVVDNVAYYTDKIQVPQTLLGVKFFYGHRF